MFSAVRRSLNNIWGMREERPFVQSKLVDLFQVGLVASILLGSVILSGFLRVVRQVSTEVGGPLDGEQHMGSANGAHSSGGDLCRVLRAVQDRAPLLDHDGVRLFPARCWPRCSLEVLKQGFAIYVANFNNYDAVYGALGGVMPFLFSLYLSSCILLIGGELIETLERYHSGVFSAELHPAPTGGPGAGKGTRNQRREGPVRTKRTARLGRHPRNLVGQLQLVRPATSDR